MGTTYATKQAATRLNVTTTTVRNWSERYADFLSISARPGYQPERRFTDKDLTILEYIKQLKGEGTRDNDIRQRLMETTFQDVEVIAPGATMQNDAQLGAIEPYSSSTPAQQEGQDLTPAVLMVVDALERRFDAKLAASDAKLATLEQAKVNDRRLVRDGVIMFMAGAITMGIIILLFIAIVWLYGNQG